MLIVFLSSFVANPLASFGIHIGISGILIWVVFFLDQFKVGKKRLSMIPRKVYFVIIGIAIYGLILGLLNLDDTKLSPDRESNIVQIINVTLYLLTVAAFIKISEPVFFNPAKRFLLLKAFVFSVFFHLFTVLITNYGYANLIPDFLIGSATIMDEGDKGLTDIVRNAGLIGDYELIVDYSIIVIFASLMLILHSENKILGVSGIISSIVIGSFSGTRSFFVVLVIVLLLIFFFNLLFIRNKFKAIKMIGVLLFLFFGLYYFILKDLVVFERLLFAIDLYNSGASIEETSNRNVLSYLPEFINSTPFIGNGSFFFFYLYKESLVSHNIFLALYTKYGIIGIMPLLMLLIYLFSRLVKFVLNSKNDAQKTEIILFISFLIGLLFQEWKVSGIRFFASIIIYVIFFMILYSHVYTLKLIQKK
ncbi:hypothetical protein [Flavobacterium sp. XS2P39]|uniref:hypothetical protein n=1 Tax=Flavobacterium sp. XS2P39 TaxID=3401725 RepID=UPI003AAF3B67